MLSSLLSPEAVRLIFFYVGYDQKALISLSCVHSMFRKLSHDYVFREVKLRARSSEDPFEEDLKWLLENPAIAGRIRSITLDGSLPTTKFPRTTCELGICTFLRMLEATPLCQRLKLQNMIWGACPGICNRPCKPRFLSRNTMETLEVKNVIVLKTGQPFGFVMRMAKPKSTSYDGLRFGFAQNDRVDYGDQSQGEEWKDFIFAGHVETLIVKRAPGGKLGWLRRMIVSVGRSVQTLRLEIPAHMEEGARWDNIELASCEQLRNVEIEYPIADLTRRDEYLEGLSTVDDILHQVLRVRFQLKLVFAYAPAHQLLDALLNFPWDKLHAALRCSQVFDVRVVVSSWRIESVKDDVYHCLDQALRAGPPRRPGMSLSFGIEQ